MKVEDFLENYEYKVTKRLLKKEYPYVINVLPTENFEQYETLSFVFVVINPYKFMETYEHLDLKIPVYLSYLGDSIIPGYIFGANLGFFFHKSSERTSPNLKPIQDDIEKTIESIRKSESIPKDLKLKQEIAVSGYMIPKNLITK
jgi:hypothetical protein